jgi:TPR repeat protein
LGTRFESGIGVEANLNSAVLWLSRAAEQRHFKAIYRLARLHARAHPEEAQALYLQAAVGGLAEAQFALARTYQRGLGGDVDLVWAVHWHRSAADQGMAAAQFALGEMFSRGEGVLPDAEAALRWYRLAAGQYHVGAKLAIERMEMQLVGGARMRRNPRGRRQLGGAERRNDDSAWVRAAESGDAESRYALGQMYNLGLGVGVNAVDAQRWYALAAESGHARAQLALAGLLERQGSRDAVDWYLKAAVQGEAQAQFALGRIYCGGQGVAPDFLRGMGWYMKAAEQGHDLALLTLGNLFAGDLRHVAVHCFAQAAGRGAAQAQYLLGQQYAQGHGVTQHAERAFMWFEKAAAQRHLPAEAALGLAYLQGNGVEKNTKLAFYWLQKAAVQGDAAAQLHLSGLFANGCDGQARDTTQALDWCQRAAEQGLAAAQSNLGVLYAQLRRTDFAIQWWEKAAAQEEPQACYQLALACLKGEGVERNPSRAFTLLLVAAEAGVAPAQSRLGWMYANAEGVAQDFIAAYQWLSLAAAQSDVMALDSLQRLRGLCLPAQLAEGERRAHAWGRAQEKT